MLHWLSFEADIGNTNCLFEVAVRLIVGGNSGVAQPHVAARPEGANESIHLFFQFQ